MMRGAQLKHLTISLQLQAIFYVWQSHFIIDKLTPRVSQKHRSQLRWVKFCFQVNAAGVKSKNYGILLPHMLIFWV